MNSQRSWANLFYYDRRLTVLTVGLVVVMGLSALKALPRLEDPALTDRFASITTLAPGKDASFIESLVTEKIEEELREIEEIKLLESSSRSSISIIIIELADDVTNVDEVWSRVRDKMNDAKVGFPQGVLDPDFNVEEAGAYALVVGMVWEQDDTPSYAILRRHAEAVEAILRGSGGTELVDMFGEPDEEILVEIDPDRLAALGMSVDQIALRLAESDAKIAAGQFRGDKDNLLLEIDSELDSLGRIANMPIQTADGDRVLPLSAVASVRKTIRTPASSLALVGGQPAVVAAARVRPDYRVDLWSREVKARLGAYAATLPPGLKLAYVFEQNQFVSARMADLARNLIFAAAAVIAVMFVMMGWRSALIVGLALPLTACLVLFGLHVLEIPIHQMSITGLIIALGLLIDNAIIVVDDVRERMHEGLTPGSAVTRMVKHLAMPLFGSTLTTALAFAPIALMPGPAGEFVYAIAISVILAVFGSLALSLTVVAAITAMTSSQSPTGGQSWWQHGISNRRLGRWYAMTLEQMFRRPIRSTLATAALPALGFLGYTQLTEQFFPPEDRNQFHIELELPPHASLEETVRIVRAARERLLSNPRIESVDWFLGESAPSFYYNVIMRRDGSSQYAQAIINTNGDLEDKTLLNELQAELDAAFPQSRVLVRQLEQGPPFKAPVELRIYGPDLDRLHGLGEEIRGRLANMPHVTHTLADLAETAPTLALTVDEEQARLAGLSHQSIARQLNAATEGTVGGSVIEATEELPVRTRISAEKRGDWSDIASLDLVRPGQDLPMDADPAAANDPYRPSAHVPLGALADVSLKPERANVPHRNGRRVNEVKVYIDAGVLPANVLVPFLEDMEADGFELPPGYEMEIGGESAELDHAIANLMSNVAPLLVIMIAALVLSFHSFRMAAIIGVVGVLAIGVGGAMLFFFGHPFGFMAIVGAIGLVGVSINDTIVVLAAIREDARARGGDPLAVRDVVMKSSRHVISTTLTTMAGFTPLLLFGGPFWEPLAVVIAGGVGAATLLALYFAPSAYLVVMCWRKCKDEPEAHPAEDESRSRLDLDDSDRRQRLDEPRERDEAASEPAEIERPHDLATVR